MTEKPFDQLAEIKKMMERSSKFLSLSGLSGISAGIIALVGAIAAFFFLNFDLRYFNRPLYVEHIRICTFHPVVTKLFVDALLVLIFAIASAFYFTWRKAKKHGEKVWNNISKRMLYSLLLPLTVGGIFSLAMVYYKLTFLVASSMLIFYGLALINAGKYTLKEIHYLGLCEILLGILGLIFPGYGLIIWAIGFGVLHIVYGIVMYYRYDN